MGEPGSGGRPHRGGPADHGIGQERVDHRRGRHRSRLPRHLAPSGRSLGAPVRDHGPSARRASRAASVAHLALHLQGDLRPRRGRRTGLRGRTPWSSSATTRETCARCATATWNRSWSMDGRASCPSRAPRPSSTSNSCYWRWASSARNATDFSRAWESSSRSRRGNVVRDDELGEHGSRGVRGRRRRARPEPDRVGHRRGPFLRRGGRPHLMGETDLPAPIAPTGPCPDPAGTRSFGSVFAASGAHLLRNVGPLPHGGRAPDPVESVEGDPRHRCGW